MFTNINQNVVSKMRKSLYKKIFQSVIKTYNENVFFLNTAQYKSSKTKTKNHGILKTKIRLLGERNGLSSRLTHDTTFKHNFHNQISILIPHLTQKNRTHII